MASSPEEQEQTDQLQPWLDRVQKLVTRRVRAARSHANEGLLADADDALTELKESLTVEILTRARHEFYAAAAESQIRRLRPDIVDPETLALLDGPNEAAATQPILGVDQVAALGRLVDRAREELVLTIGATREQPLTRVSAIATWEIRHREAIVAGATAALATAQTALLQAVGRMLIKRDLR